MLRLNMITKFLCNGCIYVLKINPKRQPSRKKILNEIITRLFSFKAEKTLTIDNMNENVKNLEYAVRGALMIRAGELEKELKAGKKYPFTEITRANLGDGQAMGQTPISFLREVLSLILKPSLMDSPRFKKDAKERAQIILEGCRGKSVGAYSDAFGIHPVRAQIAEFIQERDGYPSNYSDIYLCAGASDAIKGTLKLFNQKIDGKVPGIMVPMPQYPLYTASITEFGMIPMPYFLDEDNKWSLNKTELENALNQYKDRCNPRVLVIINPGNPTGQLLSEDNIKMVLKFAFKNKLFVFADEVYQENIWDDNLKFNSFKKVMMSMGEPYSSMELASFHSASKGFYGECGLRAGYSELINLDEEVRKMYVKLISVNLCSSVVGQAAMSCVVNPPKQGDPSYETFCTEKQIILESLRQRAKNVERVFNSIEGMKSNPLQGALYAFPSIQIPPKAIEEAQSLKMAPDMMYCLQLLERTGICVVPGSGFGQKEGTHHFRTTILPQPKALKNMLRHFIDFHEKFMSKYS